MKFGKRIQSQQFSEWSSHYLDYKGLKKCISLLLEDQASSAEAKKASFFFKLERELEKINLFYLQKENDLKVRLKTLIDKKKLIQLDSNRLRQFSPQLTSLEEAFVQFERDLNKLLKYVELNNEGFKKILKKWDKHSKSNTKELYLSRQIDIQPCFNHQILAELADSASTSRIEISHLIMTTTTKSHDENIRFQQQTSLLSTNSIINNSHNLPADDIEFGLLQALSANQLSLVQSELNKLTLDEHTDSITRAFFHACRSDTFIEIIELLVNTNKVQFDYMDDINERTFLHIASMNGRFDILKLAFAHFGKNGGCDINVRDIYGRTGLHYATMKGFDDCVSLLLDQHADIEARDLDGFSPLLYAISNGHTTSVQILLDAGANIEPENETDHIPFSVACFYGYTDIALSLYYKGAKNLPNLELLYPLHLVAQKGHVELCRILSKNHEYLDKPDIYYNWTPLFWAATYGHIECVKILISEGCELNLIDENGKTALHYAAWEGHTRCAQLMIEAGCQVIIDPPLSRRRRIRNGDHSHITQPPSLLSTEEEEDNNNRKFESELENIPSLELPPPIIPFRIYGHNYLDKKYQVHIVLKQPPIKLYDTTPISSIKLVISLNPNNGIIPHSLILPMAHQREVLQFQLDSLDHVLLEMDVLPTFGTHALGRGIIALSDFIVSEGHRTVLLLDNYLKPIGEVVFDYLLVKPFLGSQLEVGGRIETYWKSKMTGATLLTGVTDAILPATVVSSFVIASSLSGDYSRIVVQLTKDGVPVVFTNWMIPLDHLDLAVSDLTFHQLCLLAENYENNDGQSLMTFTGNLNLVQELKEKKTILTLTEALKLLPSTVGILLEIKYPNINELNIHSFSNIIDENNYVDIILQCIHDHISSLSLDTPSTRIIFTSFNPAICTLVNWKQPNFAVFFSTYCKMNKQEESKYKSTICNSKFNMFSSEYSETIRTSLKEAVRFAKRNNLLGIIADAATVVQIPSLISNIKESGLVLVTFGDINDRNDSESISIQHKQGVDAIMMHDIVHFNTEMAVGF
ncbi:uncharacterized protein BX663DRAFT_494461 [Cokeromyces recurvatus]|uniref:uncharacterized protein n=1 Tax=Cokeromyces recurvatus TaxID=90255 RepID=UPI00221F51D7|nr:uncharacterized protein BX663DRAFT_494461 [Cokeromyces recurvatus]KAI7906999.1 hypothetical protein BX663DRAFT_494461 [Cokeromyces recurvatus]